MLILNKMPKLKRLNKNITSKDNGMFSISDMFKKQTQAQSQKRAIQTQSREDNAKSMIHIIDEDRLSSDPDIEVINIEQQDNMIKTGSDESRSKCVSIPSDQNSQQSSGRDASERTQSRLSLKRKNTSLVKENGTTSLMSMSVSFNSNMMVNDVDGSGENKKVTPDTQEGKETDESQIPAHAQPYYQKNFEIILRTGIKDSDVSSLFNDTDHTVINLYFSLSEEAKKLFVRLFGRKLKWIPLDKIKYPEIADSLTPYLKELTDSQLIYDENSMTNLRDILETLSAPDIKTMAKVYHVTPSVTQKKQIVEELIKLCQRSTVSSMFGSKGGVNAAMLKKAKTLVKSAYKLQQGPRSIFVRMIMLFSLVNITTDEENGNGGLGQLFHMLMVNMGKVVYPDYKIEKKHAVFNNREDVIRYEHALQLESDLLHTIEKGNWIGAYDVFCTVSDELDKLEQDENIKGWNVNLPDFLRPFTATSVMYGLQSQGIEILQRRKEYTEAVTLIKKLLNQNSYCCSYRGYWWERLALNLDCHLKQPEEALDAVAAGLKDIHVIGGHRLALFQRAESICERPKLKLKHRLSSFNHSPIKELPKVYLEGRILHQGMTTSGPRFLTDDSYSKGNAQDMTVCGVEEFVMNHYRKNGYPRGLHAEGSIVTSLFGLLFWDILFMSIPDAFHSLYQTNPLDLYSTDSFYISRKAAIDERLARIATGSNELLASMVEDTWTNEHGKLCVGLNWDRFESVNDVNGLLQCMGGKALSGILERYAKCPRHTRSGFPDLTLWNVQTGSWKICEVKGPGDKLSHKQILWLDYLLGLGVDAEVCHVKAVAAKKLRLST